MPRPRRSAPHAVRLLQGSPGGPRRCRDGRAAPVSIGDRDQSSTKTGVALTELRELRGTAARIAAEHGLAFIAAGTHPTASWDGVRHTQANRYDGMMHDCRCSANATWCAACNVHVELPDPDQRVNVMRRMVPYLPHFIALATSSPSGAPSRTGLMGYRLAAYDELPRTGLPRTVRGQCRLPGLCGRAGLGAGHCGFQLCLVGAAPVREASDAVELRAPDSCTRVEGRGCHRHALPGAGALSGAQSAAQNAHIGTVHRAIANENKWRAQRYGIPRLVRGLGARRRRAGAGCGGKN